MTGYRILVVEDDETLRATIADVVSDDGHLVRTAADGEEALIDVKEWQPHLVILDIMMPRMDAYEFRKRQRAASNGTRPFVLIVSAATDVASAAKELEADAWLAKPFTLEEMVATVNTLLAERDTSGHGASLS